MSVLHHFYVVEAENGLVKVGFTTAAPEKRLQDLRTLIVRQYVLLCAISSFPSLSRRGVRGG